VGPSPTILKTPFSSQVIAPPSKIVNGDISLSPRDVASLAEIAPPDMVQFRVQ
jgi:hypothetical protein